MPPRLQDDYTVITDQYNHTWKQPSGEFFYLRCCDCSLVHRVTLTATDPKVKIHIKEAVGETKRVRRLDKAKRAR